MQLKGVSASSSRNRRILRFTFGYGLFASMWILFSDLLLAELTDVTKILWLSATKGMLFVLVSTLLIFLALRAVSTREGRNPAAYEQDTAVAPPIRLSRLFRYLISVLLSLCFLVLSCEISVSYGDPPLLLIMFMFPILLSAMLGGIGPGLMATAVTALGVNFIAISPQNSLLMGQPHDLFQWGFLIANGLLVSWLSELFHRAVRRIAAEHLLQDAILSSIGDGVINTDPQGRIVFLNKEAERMTGWTMDHALGQPLTKLFEPGSSGALAINNVIQSVLHSGTRMHLAHEGLLQDKTGHGLSLTITVSPIQQIDHQPKGVVLVLRYDSEQKQMERALRVV